MTARASSYRWIPWAFVGALAVVMAVNGALAYFAVTSSTGLVTEHPFTRGNGYNRVLDAGAAQDALGWHGQVRFSGHVGAPGELDVAFTDKSGQTVPGLSVTAHIVRPVEPLAPIVLPLALDGGVYAGRATLSRPGQWEVRVAARRGAELFEFAQRIIVK